VRNRDGEVITAVQMEQTSPDEVLVEPVLEEGDEAEDIEVTRSELHDLDRFFANYRRA
jgi:hypothetical protein